MKDDDISQVIVVRRFFVGWKDRPLLRPEAFWEELFQESHLVPKAEVLGAADVAALELVAVASVDDAKRRNLDAKIFNYFIIVMLLAIL